MRATYDQIGIGYTRHRRPDPRIFARLRQHLHGMASILNVGAGAGSYEPDDVPLTAVELSTQMIAQRQRRTSVVQARAEALPFPDDSFDATMGVLTIHHWTDKRLGLRECARVARRRLVLLTWDPDSCDFWLFHDYFPELLAHDKTMFPTMDQLRDMLGPILVEPLPIPADCQDGFLGAYWRRPTAYFNPSVRAGISSLARLPADDARLMALKEDLESGAWDKKYGSLLHQDELDLGYRIVVANLMGRAGSDT